MNRVTIFCWGKVNRVYDFCLGGKVKQGLRFLLGKGEQSYDFVGGKVNRVTILLGKGEQGLRFLMWKR